MDYKDTRSPVEIVEDWVKQYSKICKSEAVVKSKIAELLNEAITGDDIFNAFNESDYKPEYLRDMAIIAELEGKLDILRDSYKEDYEQAIATIAEIERKWHS